MKLQLSRLIAGAALVLLTVSAWASDDAESPIGRFEIARFDVQGNTLLAPSDIEKLLARFTGKDRDFGDVQRALEALEDAYRQRGFNVVQVALPEQELNQGVIRLNVVEVHIGKVTVEGNKFFDVANIRRSLPGLREGATPNIAKISESLRLANENPAKKVNLQLQNSDSNDDIDSILKVEDDKTWSIGMSLDNTGDATTGRSRASVLYQNANVGGLDHVLSLQYTTALQNPDKVSVYGVGYHVPLYALGDSIDVFGSYSNVDSGSVSAGIFDLQVSGQGAAYGARYNHNLARVGAYDSKMIFGLDYKAFQNSVQLQGVQLGNDVTVHPVSASYVGTWNSAAGQAGFYITGLHNLPGGERGSADDFNRVRAGASATYTALRYGATYSLALPLDWQLRLNLSGQYTRDSLVPGEQFGAGGATSVRGFREREIANDSGHLENVEVYTPNVCGGVKLRAAQCRILAFYDTAQVTRNNALPGEQAHASIGSIGLGLRLLMDKYFSLQMDYGQVVDASDTLEKGERRLHFRVNLSY